MIGGGDILMQLIFIALWCLVPGTTRVKFSKSEENSAAFIERRRAGLER